MELFSKYIKDLYSNYTNHIKWLNDKNESCICLDGGIGRRNRKSIFNLVNSKVMLIFVYETFLHRRSVTNCS